MRPTKQSFIRKRFRNFTLHIPTTTISGKHDVRFIIGAGEFILQMMQDEIDSVQSAFQQAHSMIEANLPGRCTCCDGIGEMAMAGINAIVKDCQACNGTGLESRQEKAA